LDFSAFRLGDEIRRKQIINRHTVRIADNNRHVARFAAIYLCRTNAISCSATHGCSKNLDGAIHLRIEHITAQYLTQRGLTAVPGPRHARSESELQAILK